MTDPNALAAFISIALILVGQIVVMAFWARGQSAKGDQNARDIVTLGRTIHDGLASKLSIEQGRAIEAQVLRHEAHIAENAAWRNAVQASLAKIEATLAGLQAQVMRILEAEDEQRRQPHAPQSPLEQLRGAIEILKLVKGTA